MLFLQNYYETDIFVILLQTVAQNMIKVYAVQFAVFNYLLL